MDYTVLIRSEAVPLSEQIEQSHSIAEASLKIAPHTVTNLLEVAYSGEHREDTLHNHASVPLPGLAYFEVGGVSLVGLGPYPAAALAIAGSTFSRVEAMVSYYYHLLLKVADERVEGSVIDVGSSTIPPHHQPPFVEHEAELTPTYPDVVGDAEATYLLWRASSSLRVQQLYTESVRQPQESRLRYEPLCPLSMSSKQPQQASALREFGEQRTQVTICPPVEGTITSSSEAEEQSQRHYLPWIQACLAMFGYLCHRIVYSAEQLRDKIGGSHGVLPPWCVVTTGYRRTL
jgi:hypothetical protein